MKAYQIINQITGESYGIYKNREAAKKAYNECLTMFTDEKLYSFAFIELPEVEDPELDYEYIDCLINTMIDSMEKICSLANLDYISLSYFITEDKDTGASMSAWNGDSHGIAVITNRINIFKRIHKQIKEEQKIYERIKEGSKNEKN